MCRELFNQNLGKHVLNGKHIGPLNILQVWTGHVSSAQYTFHIAHSFKRLHNSLKRHWRFSNADTLKVKGLESKSQDDLLRHCWNIKSIKEAFESKVL